MSVRSGTFMITYLQFFFSSRLDYLGLFFGGAGVGGTCILLSLCFFPSSAESLNTWHVNWGL